MLAEIEYQAKSADARLGHRFVRWGLNIDHELGWREINDFRVTIENGRSIEEVTVYRSGRSTN